MLEDDYYNLILLDKDLKKLENIIQLQSSVTAGTRSIETCSDNRSRISRMRHRMSKLKREVESRSVDLFPSRSKPAIFRSARYIRLFKRSYSLSYNFRWDELQIFLSKFDDDSYDMKMFAGIQSVVSLSHQSRKKQALAMLDSLILKVGSSNHG